MVNIGEKYFVYTHTRLDKNQVFYVGIGTICLRPNVSYRKIFNRAYNKSKRNQIWKRITAKTDYEIQIIYRSDSQDEVKNKEMELIRFYGRIDQETGTLANMTDGGDGCLNPCRLTPPKKRADDGWKERVSEFFRKEVFVYSIDGMLANSYRSMSLAAEKLGTTTSNMTIRIKEKRPYKNLFFSYEKHETGLDLNKYKAKCSRYAVIKFDKNKKPIAVYDGLSCAATKEKASATTISMAIKHERFSLKSYWMKSSIYNIKPFLENYGLDITR